MPRPPLRTIHQRGCPFPVTRLVLGTADYGATVDQDGAFACLDRFADAGGNHVDTAHIYAAWVPHGWGASERFLGAWLRSRGMAGRVAVATKGGHFDLDGVHAPRVRPDCIHRDIGESLERLGLPGVPLWYLHRDDPLVPVDELLGALEDEVKRGRIGAYAASNWTPQRMDAARRCAVARGWTGFAVHQVQWSLAEVPAEGGLSTRAMDAELFAWHRQTGMPVAAYSPQANGFFARAWTWPAPPLVGGERKFARYLTAANVARWRMVERRAPARDATRNQIALAWLLAQPFTVLPVVGCRTPEQVDDSCGADAIELSAAEMAALASAADGAADGAA